MDPIAERVIKRVVRCPSLSGLFGEVAVLAGGEALTDLGRVADWTREPLRHAPSVDAPGEPHRARRVPRVVRAPPRRGALAAGRAAVRLHRRDRLPPRARSRSTARRTSGSPRSTTCCTTRCTRSPRSSRSIALWVLVFGWEWALLAIPIHLFGDRSLFGNTLKPFAEVRSRRCRRDGTRLARRRHEPGDDSRGLRPAVLVVRRARSWPPDGHDPALTVPPHMLAPGPLREALAREYAFRSVAEEKATRALSYLVAIAPDDRHHGVLRDAGARRGRHAMVFRNHLVAARLHAAGRGRSTSSPADDVRRVLDPLEEFALAVMRDDRTSSAGWS